MLAPTWLTAFVDLPRSSFGPATHFWQAVTGYTLSGPRGPHREFASLLPPDGDAHLRVQRVADGPGGIHLDLHVDDPRAAADEAVLLGASEVADNGYVVLRSPGGFTFCVVPGSSSRRAAPATWPGATRSIVDQVCLDIPSGVFEEETAFWAGVTGWEPRSSTRPEFASLARPDAIAVRLLFQRLGERSGTVRGHLDLACDNRVEEVRRHAALGASLVAEHQHWTVLRDPAGAAYCITDRAPQPAPPVATA